MPTTHLILLSGGMDSAASLAFYTDLGFSTRALFIDYGQPARDAERKSAIDIAEFYSTPLETIVCRGPREFSAGEIQGRNAFLVMTALLYDQISQGVIALGIHAGTTYYDCQNDFVLTLSRLIDGYTNGRVLLGTPFFKWSKQMIWSFSKERNVPLNLTWSCEASSLAPCRNCLSCLDLKAIDACTK